MGNLSNFEVCIFTGQLVIAFIMMFIAYRQWKTEDNKRKQDLFNNRYDIYTKTLAVFKHIKGGGKIDDEVKFNLIDLYNKALFLFSKDVAEYILSFLEMKKTKKVDLNEFNDYFIKYMKMKK